MLLNHQPTCHILTNLDIFKVLAALTVSVRTAHHSVFHWLCSNACQICLNKLFHAVGLWASISYIGGRFRPSQTVFIIMWNKPFKNP